MIRFSLGMTNGSHTADCLAGALPVMMLVCLMTLLCLAPTSGAFAGSEMRLNAASANGRNIDVGLNKSVVIETPRDVRDVLVSSPSVADAVVRTPRRVYIIGMAIGQANVILFDGNGNQIASFDVNVARDNASLAALLRLDDPLVQHPRGWCR